MNSPTSEPVIIDAPAAPATSTHHGVLTGLGLWTRERAMVVMGFDPSHLRHAYGRNLEALDASLPRKVKTRLTTRGEVEETIEDGGAPDWETRMDAIRAVYGLVGIRDAKLEPGDERSPVSIKIVVNEQASNPESRVVVRVPRQ